VLSLNNLARFCGNLHRYFRDAVRAFGFFTFIAGPNVPACARDRKVAEYVRALPVEQRLATGVQKSPASVASILTKVAPTSSIQYMALIRSIEPGSSAVRINRTEVDCPYQVLDDEHRGRIVHLATYGSDDRASQPKVSQVIQLDEHQGRKLLGILQRAFPPA
jgi:hypothetical protein